MIIPALLGEGIFNSFHSGNTNCPGSLTQPLHRDGPHLWPGTHLHPFPENVVDRETEEAQREVYPPVSGCAKKGSVLIRDVRLWHRGVPNRSDRRRHMIAQVHCIRWYRNRGPVKFNTGCEDAFPDDCGMDHNAEFTGDPIDYLMLKRG